MDAKDICRMRLFDEIVMPPDNIKKSWKEMIPDWAERAMVEDIGKVIKREMEREDCNKESLEIMIRNRLVFIKREAFFPECFLREITNDVLLGMIEVKEPVKYRFIYGDGIERIYTDEEPCTMYGVRSYLIFGMMICNIEGKVPQRIEVVEPEWVKEFVSYAGRD